MDTSIVTTDPIWTDTTTIPRRQRLDDNVRCDVCVVGAGIAGLTTAYLLACEGRDVVVLDRAGIGGGETACTTAHLVNALDDGYADLERLHGEDGARLAAESHTKAIDQIESIVDDEQIDCAFERLDGYLFTPPGDEVELLDEELAAAHRAGLHDVQLVRRVPWPSFDTGLALRFPGQAQFHPMRYLAGLARAVEARGGRIHTDTSPSTATTPVPSTSAPPSVPTSAASSSGTTSRRAGTARATGRDSTSRAG
jgi:glycine/D-amino acid oxidase-like deaminating enzyme